MSKIKGQYLLFYDSSREDYDDALRVCHETWSSDRCDNKCSACPLQNIKDLFVQIHNLCEKALTEN